MTPLIDYTFGSALELVGAWLGRPHKKAEDKSIQLPLFELLRESKLQTCMLRVWFCTFALHGDLLLNSARRKHALHGDLLLKKALDNANPPKVKACRRWSDYGNPFALLSYTLLDWSLGMGTILQIVLQGTTWFKDLYFSFYFKTSQKQPFRATPIIMDTFFFL